MLSSTQNVLTRPVDILSIKYFHLKVEALSSFKINFCISWVINISFEENWRKRSINFSKSITLNSTEAHMDLRFGPVWPNASSDVCSNLR